MKKIHKIMVLMSLLAGGLLTSCNDENPWKGSDTEGGIALELASDGRVMRHSTRSDDTMCPIVPDPSAFKIKLTNADGSYSKNWDAPEHFNNETGFPIGDYTLEATHGDISVEGFELPHYYGNCDVHVSPGTTAPVRITAALANSMVSVRYTDAFTSNFSNYSSAVQTPGHDWVMFAKGETRPAFIDPTGSENTKFSVTLTNKDGKTVTIEPANFQVLPRRHYIITVNAVGNTSTGTLALDIEFEEEVVAETVNVPLGDELFSSPEPEITPKGFTENVPLSLIEYEGIEANPQFDITSFAGFQEVTLNFISNNGYAPMFGNSVQLVGADALTQTQLAGEGVNVYGLYKNTDKMAVVNVKDLASKLPAGEYTVQLQAKDAMTRLSEPKSVSFTVDPVIFEVSSSINPDYKAKVLAVDVATNSSKLKDIIKFKAPDEQNRMVEATVKSVTSINVPDGSSASEAYRFELNVAPVSSSNIDVEAEYGKLMRNLQVEVNAPEYELTVDAFANFAVIKVDADIPELKNDLMTNLRIYNGNVQVSPSNISRDAEKGYIIISGLTPSTDYDSMKGVLLAFDHPIDSFTTEADNNVENGDFSIQGTHYYFTRIESGGNFGLPNYQNHTTINRYDPQGWSSLNPFTCYENSTTKNTWFMVPSTFMDKGAVTIRTVGYHHNGVKPAHDRSEIYNGNAPTELNISAGELFLGSYSYNGTESRTDGISFSSRPMSMSFDYHYTPMSGEKASVNIQVMAADNSVIASRQILLSQNETMENMKVDLPSYIFGKKGTKLYISFRSVSEGTTPQIRIPSGQELHEPGHTGWNSNIPENEYHALATGSVLIIDNVHLGYDRNETVISAPRRTNKR